MVTLRAALQKKGYCAEHRKALAIDTSSLRYPLPARSLPHQPPHLAEIAGSQRAGPARVPDAATFLRFARYIPEWESMI
jgi:hypothetical protein